MRIRIRATGQVIDKAPRIAAAMINGGTAEPVEPVATRELSIMDRARNTAAKFIKGIAGAYGGTTDRDTTGC